MILLNQVGWDFVTTKKEKSGIVIYIFLVIVTFACTTEGGYVATQAPLILSTNTNFVLTATLRMPTQILVYVQTPTPISATHTSPPQTPTAMSQTITATPQFALCPVENQYITDIYAGFGGNDNLNYDILAPHGTPLRSPGECTVKTIFIDSQGNQGIRFACSGYPLNKAVAIDFGHVDLAWNNYATLRFYGIPIDKFFLESGIAMIKKEAVPNQNAKFHIGEGPIAYIGNTGDHEMPYHVHINMWKSFTNETFFYPAQFFACP